MIGYGIAYFCWHRFRWPDWNGCKGWKDDRTCAVQWRHRNPPWQVLTPAQRAFVEAA